MLSVMSVSAQESNDTIVASSMSEVVIEAPKVIRKADMNVYYPSQSAVDNSRNGMQLLGNLLIPTLTVNDALESITSLGDNVQVRINGRVATLAQVKALLPVTIKRVEWIDNPGLRYNGAKAVLNFIVVNPAAGGSLMTGGMPALNCAWGQYWANAKLNNGRSQWGASANYKLTNHLDAYRDYQETFTYADGSKLIRNETPEGGSLGNTFGGLQLDYSYIRPDTTVFWVAVHGYREWPSEVLHKGILSLSNGANAIHLTDLSGSKGFTPSVAVYFEQHFSHDQVLAVDVNASLYNGRTSSSYYETDDVTKDVLTDVSTSIRDCNKAIGVETNYIKNWKSSRLTAGISYAANRNRSIYDNLDGQVFHQRQDKLYFFSEYLHRIGKVTLTAGLGAQYTAFKFRESGLGRDSWNLRPQFSAVYKVGQVSQFRLNFTSWQTSPSLSETNVVAQQIDGFQWQVGNPDLKTSSSYMMSLRYDATLPRVNGSVGVSAFTSPDAITPWLRWEGDRLLTSYENSRGLQNVSVWFGPQIDVVPKWLNISGSVEYRAERMRGTSYRLYNHNWNGNVTAQLMHWGFVLSVQYRNSRKSLWGEKISWGESVSMLDLTYNFKNWSFAAGMIMPFGRYDNGSMSLNPWNSNESHVRLDMRIPYIRINYNLQWGRQKQGARKLVNADADVSQSSAGRR